VYLHLCFADSTKKMAQELKESEKEEGPRRVGKYEIYETLGKGGYSWVKRGYDTVNETTVALKFQTRVNDEWALEQAEQVRTEIKSLTTIRHENVMRLYAYNLSARYETKAKGVVKCILFVLEFCPGGELFDILYYTDAMDEIMARTYFHQMINGLAACHTTGVAHRDIKPQNLLLDGEFNIKITDFGLSKIIERDADFLMRSTYVGTRGYQAPELLLNRKYTNSIDIFSLGVIFFIMLAGYPPFERAHSTDKWYKPLVSGDTEGFWKRHKNCKIPKNVRDLVTGMLCFRPSRRVTIDEIKDHPWWTGPTYGPGELKKKVINKFREARKKRKADPRKQADLLNSIDSKTEAKRLINYEHYIDSEFQDHSQCSAKTCDLFNFPYPPIVTDATRPKGLCVYKTKLLPHIAIFSLSNLFRRHVPGAMVDHTVAVDPYKFKVLLRTPDVDGVRVEYQMEVAALKLAVSEEVKDLEERGKILIEFRQIKVTSKLMWVRLFRSIMDEVLTWDILEDGIGIKKISKSEMMRKPEMKPCKSGKVGVDKKNVRAESDPRLDMSLSGELKEEDLPNLQFSEVSSRI